ncbi:MAG: NAD(P) transhydrogenase subunit alpha [Oscillospiraceae bacterium]|nr:NAD(P) transhydrogenase subunit alpha [Oscillospiraceae bacterium]
MIFLLLLFILIIATFLGRELISKVPSQLHTPLMSATNAISGVTVLGALVVCAANTDDVLILVLSVIAIILATINTVGGYAVTDRMLGMFKKKEDKKQ